jgi:hypothetical protein
MEWIKATEAEPTVEGKYFCLVGKKKKCLWQRIYRANIKNSSFEFI